MKFKTTGFVLALAFLLAGLAPTSRAAAEPKSAESIPATALIQPAELAAQLRTTSGDKPLMLQVGAHVLYAQAHVPGSEYVGPGGEDSGLKALRERVAKLPKQTPIVIYCGCCPWSHCPNMGAAFDQLHSLGFTHVKALYIADDFGTNWVDMGYPVAKGE